MQGLKEFTCQANEIGDEGAQYLADALRNNKVNIFVS
jgi:hypothetical protein